MTERGLKNNVFYSTFTNFFWNVFLRFLTFFYLFFSGTFFTSRPIFSKLKLVKNFLRIRSTMSPERLSYLAVLLIENHRAQQLDTSGIVEAFAQAKARKLNKLLTDED